MEDSYIYIKYLVFSRGDTTEGGLPACCLLPLSLIVFINALMHLHQIVRIENIPNFSSIHHTP
jgi:hypothetical protein